MKPIVFLFLAFLVISSSASTTLLQGLAQVSRDPMGAAILASISLNLRAKTPINEITELLNEILNGLLAESQNSDTHYSTTYANLQSAIASGLNLVNAYQSSIDSLKESVDSATSSSQTSQDSLTNNQAALVNEQNLIASLENDANTAIPNYDADIADLQNAISAIKEAIAKMNSYKRSSQGASSFIQLGSTIKQDLKDVAITMQGMRKRLSKHSNLYTPLVRELIDLSSTVDQSNADKVIDLLTQLLQLLNDALSSTQSARASYSSNYENQKDRATENVANYQATIDTLVATINNLSARAKQSQQDLENTQASLDAVKQKLNSDQANLDQLQSNYDQQKQNYKNVIGLVRKVIDYFQQNVAAVDDFTRQQLEAGTFY